MNKVKLSKKTNVANGCHRAIHLYPNFDNLLIKVRGSDKGHKGHSPFKTWMYKTFPATLYRGFYTEIHLELKTQLKANALNIKSPIAPTRGLVDTNLGLGMVMERIGPKEKVLGPTLRVLQDQNKLNNEKIKLLNNFAKSLFTLKIVCADINTHNIVWSEVHKRFFIVDGFGDRNLIKLRTYIKFLRDKRVNRGLQNSGKALGLNWSAETHEFSRK